MIKDYPGEKWKTIKFDIDFFTDHKLEISNYGRLKSFNKNAGGEILNGTMINGYPILRAKILRPREEKMQLKIARQQQQFANLSKEIILLKKQKGTKKSVAEKEAELKQMRRQLDKILKDDNKQRSVNFHALVHRLVADYFLPKQKTNETVVAHLDYNKQNNKADNLKWMTREENFRHQQKSPHVIKQKEQRRYSTEPIITASKLTVTKVMLLKKLLNQNKPIKQLRKQFKITDTQILRIKRGENWKHVPAG